MSERRAVAIATAFCFKRQQTLPYLCTATNLLSLDLHSFSIVSQRVDFFDTLKSLPIAGRLLHHDPSLHLLAVVVLSIRGIIDRYIIKACLKLLDPH